jgi:hypothetical protein
MLKACADLERASETVPKIVADGLPGILSGTAVRAQRTFHAICELVVQDYTQQAAMLLRSLFEDMVVMHWLLLNEANGDWYAQRLLAHRDAMMLAAERVDKMLGWPSRSDVSHLVGRENELKQFGDYAQRDWWAYDAKGTKRSLPKLVAEVGQADRFRGRTHGETPVLEHVYQVVHKWANQQLHHTAAGLGVVRIDDTTVALDGPTPLQVLSPAYYCFAMTVCAIVDLGGITPQEHPFWTTFSDGLQVFGNVTGHRPPTVS